ncbi:TerB family tellurite resistance protein [Pseudomonadales bacterium]|nr:TerB family tellurite resistance protein [Pseudomonadales bacterium]MDB9879251.1 TerB family tellurite resistance protein [Pseudomonadales bacterium]MDC0174470.1 TerB family tellurite resistance protein [Pseudomonadales bacterium]MDC1308326.1 TerB family tellurite resistance protein [Pseudomonadales bacterium]
MLEKIKRFFDEKLLPSNGDGDSDDNARSLQFAMAALLLELARADFDADDQERDLIMSLLRDTFALDEADLLELLELAGAASDEANDVFQFTQLVNQHYHHDDKIHLVEQLWRVAFADGRLDKYEEQFIRKLSGLLHVAHSDFIKAKLRARQSQS